MTWILLSIGAFFVWAVGNILGKIIITKIAKHPLVYLVIFNVIMGIITLLILPFKGIYLPETKILIYSIISGIIYVFAVMPYMYAIKNEEVSRVVPLWQFIPLFTLILATIFLNETLSFYSYIAFILLVTGGLLISAKKLKGLFSLRHAFYLMLGSSFLFAAMDIINKYVFSNSEYFNSFIIMRLTAFVVALTLLFYKDTFIEFKNTISQLTVKKTSVLLTSEILDYVGMVLYSLALSIGPVIIISSMHGFQPLFVLIFAIIVSIFAPHHLKEQIDKNTILLKILAIVLMGLGVYLLYV